MTQSNILSKNSNQNTSISHRELHHPEWDQPVICRVEVDLPAWLAQLAGGKGWEVYSEDEEESCVSFALRQGEKLAEVTLYHNGYAVVDVEGQSVFDGSLTAGTSDCAHLSYYRADNGEQIMLN
jgi:hypothetical protein